MRRLPSSTLRPVAVSMALLSLTMSTAADAYDFEVTSRTEGYGYQLRRYEQDGIQFLNRRRITQHLGLRVFNLLDPGEQPFLGGSRRAPALLTFHAALRFDTDFGSYAETAPVVDEIENNQLDLLLGGLEGRNLFGFLDLNLGRQLDTELFDFFAFDGLRLRANVPLGRALTVYVETYVGTEVAGAHPFSSTVFQRDGAGGDRARDSWSPVFGAAVGADGVHGIQLRAAYRGVASRAPRLLLFERGESDSIWGVDEEVVFLGAGLELPWLRLRPQLGLRYDLLTAELDDLDLTLGAPLGSRVQAQIEYLRSRPHFDGDSIFNLFALEPFSELCARATVRLGAPLSLAARLGYRWLWSADAEGDGAEAHAGTAGLIATWTDERLRAELEAYYSGSELSSTVGADLDGDWRLRRWLWLQGRVSLVRQEGEPRLPSVLSFGVQAGARVQLVAGARLHVMLEDNVSQIARSALRALCVLDLEFAP